MKKILVFLLAALLVLSLAACGGDKEPNPSGGTDNPGTSQQTPSGTNTPDPGNASGEIVTGGEEGAAAPSEIVLPANVKMEISADGNLDQTTVKIGNDYYTKDRYGDQSFFKYSADDGWLQYYMSDGRWEENGYRTYDDIIDKCFISINSYAALSVEPVTTGRSQTIAGVKTKEYKYALNGTDLFCWMSDDGISFNHNDFTVISLWDTSVTSFGFDTP